MSKIRAGKNKKTWSFVWFALIGVINTLIDLAVFSLFIYLACPYMLAQILGYMAGMVNSYIWNNKVTFREQSLKGIAGHARRSMRFIIWNLLMLGLSAILLYIIYDHAELALWLAKIIVTFIMVVINYIGSKKFVFIRQENKAETN